MPNNANSLELLVRLGIDKSNKTDLQTQVDALGKSLAGLKVDIKIDPSAIKALERLSTMDFSKLAASAKKATDDVSKSTRKTAEEAEKIMKETFGSKIPKAIEKGFSGSANDIKKQFKSMGFENIKVGFDVKNGKQQMDKLVASVEKDGITKTVHFKQATVANNGRDSALWMPDKVIDSDKSLVLAAKNVDQLIAKMNKLQTEGKLTNTQFEHLTSSIKNIDKQGGIKGLNAQLDQFVVNNKKATEAVRATERAQKEQVAELKRQEDAQKRIIENEIRRKNLVLDIERAMKSQSRSIDQTAARNLLEQTKQLDVTSKNFSTSLKQNQSGLKELNTNATEATRSNMGVISSFKTAMEKFPIWMAASTVFYSITRGATDLTRKVIELDTALVNMQRVMDMPSYKFNDMLEQSMVNVENLSGKLGDYLNLVTEFGRMGFDSVESLDMSNTAQMLANISDLKSDESVSSLVAAMTAFNITAEDSIDIADKLNEVDNQYSITTKDLALSMNKSASTAKVFGASLDQLLGYTTAIGSATRESGNVVGNSLKSIMSRIMTLPRAATALSQIGISIKDMGGEVRPVADVIDELGRKWNTLSAAEQQNTAIKVAGTNQLGRFNALMLNYQTAVDATTTSITSQGSATQEQEKYNKSLEARINRLSTAWYGLADSVGKSILYDGIVVLTSAFEGAAKTGDSAVASFGALPILFGVLGSSVALLSGRFSTWTGTMIANRATAMAATATNGSLSASLLTVAATSTVAQRALMMTGVGIALVAAAGAVTLLTKAVSKHIQEQEEFDLYLEKNTGALGVNKQATEELITQYNNLTKAKESGSWDSEKEEEYLAVQQKLGEFFPALIDKIDSTGQSHIKSKEAIESEIKATEELIAAQNRLIVENSSEEFKKLNDELNGSWADSFSNFIYGSLEARIKEQKNILEALNKSGADEGILAKQELKLKQLERQSQQTSEEIKGHIFTVANAMNDIDINSDLSDMLQEFVGGLDVSKLDSTQLEAFAKEIGKIQEALQNALNNDDKDAFDSTIARLNNLASETKGFDSSFGKLDTTIENGNLTIKDSAGIIHTKGEAIEEATEQTDVLAEAFSNATSNISSLNSIVNELNEGNGLTAKSMQVMMEKYPELLSYLDNEALMRIKVAELIGKEEEAAKQAMIAKLSVSKEAYEKMYKDNRSYFDALSKEYGTDFANFKNLAQAKVEAENAVMNKLSQNWSKYYSAQANALTAQGEAYFKNMSYAEAVAVGNGTYDGEDADFLRQFSRAKDAARGISEAFDEMSFKSFNVDGLGLSMEGLTNSTKNATKAEKEAAKALETSIYVTDKYKKSLEAVSLEIEKQQALREGQPNYSKIYQDSLQKEIQLEKNKKKLMEDQAAALEKQIKSGKILQTGIITTSSGGSSSSSGYTGQYSSQINSSASKYGVDPNLIAAIIKQESNFNSSAVSSSGARGLMQLMPSTAKGLGVKDSFDPTQNIDGGTKYIAEQIKAFGGDIKKALYAYNAGAGNVSKILASSDKYWKEPKNYANKVLANLASGTGTSKISGWNGNVTSGYGMRNDPFTGKQKMHSGVDIAGKKGDRLDSNVSGKVSFAGKGTGSMSGFGNYVAIETADGLKHFYAHLDKVIAKVGDTVAVGSQIGNIGSTGSSTGSHLHYQVNKNGKAIDPSGYLNNAKNTEGSTKEAAQVQQSIDQANSDLITLRSQILATNKEIAALEVESIQGYLDGYNRQREDYQHTLDFENAKQEAISQTSSAYRSSIDKQITAMKGQQSANQAELKFSEKLIAGGNMSAETMIMLKDRVKALKVEMLQLGAAIEDANFEKINSRMVAFDESQDDLQFLVDLSSEYMSTLTEGSAEYNKAANDQIATMQKQQRMIRTQIDEHTKDLATKKLSVQATKDLREKIEDLTLSYWSLGNGIKSSTESLVEANKKMANDVADKLIETYKDYTQERQDAHMKTIDAEMKAEEKRHKQVSDNLSKELESYRKIIQAKLEMLDKEESERDYNKEIDELEKDRLDTLNKIALLSLDDSFEARKETANLTEKLTATEEQIAEKRHDREIELRKANLTDLIESKEEEIKNRQDLEDERYEHEKELIDKQKEYWQQYYTDLLNDERKFAKLREDIVAGNTDAIKSEFGEILDYFNETMPNLENTLDGTMQAVGTSIRQNMIDTLKEALDLMNQIGSNTGSGVPNKVADQFDADKGASTTPDKAQADAKANQKGLGQITIEKPVNLWKRVGDKLVHDNGRILKAGEKFSVYGRDDKFGGQYNVGGGNWVTDIPGYVKYKKFDTGGYTKTVKVWLCFMRRKLS